MNGRDRYRGCLVGLALGDALGSPYEFKLPPFEVDGRFHKGVFGHDPGDGTDDTSLATFCAEALLEGDLLKGYPPRLVEWAGSGPPDVGTQTMRAAVAWKLGGPPPPDQNAQSNGSLMAAAPIALRWMEDPRWCQQQASDFAMLTHPSETAATVNVRYTHLLRECLGGVLPAEPANRGWPQATGSGTGWCELTLTLARMTLALGEKIEPHEALLELIRRGGDTDTNGAVAGALLGARHGIGAWPVHLLDELLPAERMISLADALFDAAREPR